MEDPWLFYVSFQRSTGHEKHADYPQRAAAPGWQGGPTPQHGNLLPRVHFNVIHSIIILVGNILDACFWRLTER
jgi:hypothetical protein